jgi:DUF4097 and DUF4098 domain-containing protein YvlB
MNTRHFAIATLVAASLALARPALAQTTDPCKDLSRLKDLSQLAELSNLGDQIAKELANLPDLAWTQDLAQQISRDLSRDISRSITRDLTLDFSHLGDLAELKALEGLGQQSARHERTRGPEQTERFSKTFRVGPNGSLDLSNISGDIVVKAGTGDDIVVDAIKRTPQGADAQKNLQAVTIEAVEHGGRVEVRTRYPENAHNVRTSVDYAVTVPAGTSLNLHSISGDVRVTAVKGSVRIETISGDTTVTDADQLDTVKAVSGDVTITRGAGSDVRASTINGDLTLRNVKAKSLDASSISGDVKLNDVTTERTGVKTISGNVEYDGPLSRGGRYEFVAHSGDVRITMAPGAGAEINAETFSGDIQSPLPAAEKAVSEKPGRHMGEHVHGTIGDGSALLSVKTFSGDVTIVKK